MGVLPVRMIVKDPLSPPSVAFASDTTIFTEGNIDEGKRRNESNCCCAIGETSAPTCSVAFFYVGFGQGL